MTAGTARYSLFKQGGNYFLLDLQRATLHALAVEGQDYSYSAAFSPDGQFVLVASVAGLWQLPTRDPTEKTLIDTTAVTTAQFIDETSFVYISEGNVLKRASTQGVNSEDLAQDVVTFYPTDDTVFFSTSAGGLYGLELASLTSRLVHPFSAPVQVVWADADQALVTIEEDGIWFYVTLATGELLSLDALDGALPVAGLRPESDAVLFSDSLDVGDPRTFWGLDLTTGQVAEVGDFPNGWTGQPEGSQLLVAVFDHAERSTDLYRLDAHGGGTPLFKALNVWGAFSPDGRFVAVDARTGNPDYRASEGLTLLLNADGTLVRELGRGGYGVLWLSEPE